MKTLLLDTETTGLIDNIAKPMPKQPYIIEFCGCLLDEETGAEQWTEMLISCPVPITEKITEITGITADMLHGQPPFEAIADRIAELIAIADRVVAHNLSYDRDMLEIEFRRLGRTIEWPELRCTMEGTAHWEGKWLSLGRLHEKLFGDPHTNAHRARPDVEALVRIYKELRKRGEI